VHKRTAWTDDRMPDLPLERLVAEFLLSSKKSCSPATLHKYRTSLASFVASIVEAGDDPVLASVTPAAGDRWVAQMQARCRNGRVGRGAGGGCADETILGRQAAVKVFTRKFCFQERELTNYDLLGRWSRVKVSDAPKPRLTDVELADIAAAFDDSPLGLRDKAFLSVYLSTGLRFDEVRRMSVSDVDPVSGEFEVTAKGDKKRYVRMSGWALKACKRYLRWRQAADADVTALWTTDDGTPLSYDGAMSLFRRLKKKSGVRRLHAHLLRHTFGQIAIEDGAAPAQVQDMLGHDTDAMTRRYTRDARAKAAAALMPRYARAWPQKVPSASVRKSPLVTAGGAG